jgi:hypothetical protein
MYSVTMEVELNGSISTKVIIGSLLSNNEAWEAGHTWLMENNRPYECLDIRLNGEVVDYVSWEP